jgi:(E)-4-hydroxy-3-methylbut-2-enyl-diphosphate synthase
MQRRETIPVMVWDVQIGWDAPIVIQSMTNTPTRDVFATTVQIKELAMAGSEIVRITVNDDRAAEAVPKIVKNLRNVWVMVPIVGDFHYNGHTLLNKFPELAANLDKYRINPGNVGKWEKRDDNFKQIIECAIRYNTPVRIGINGGSLDDDLLSANMEVNATLKNPKEASEVFVDSMVESALLSVEKALEYGLAENMMTISVKMSDIQDMISCYTQLSEKTNLPLHLGLTEAGWAAKGIVSSSIALWLLLQQWIGDTIRVSITPEPGARRALEVEVCKNILQTMGIRSFQPLITSCPGCGRTSSDSFQILSKQIGDEIALRYNEWKEKYKAFATTNIAVMGCIVNGPGEARNADIGIFLPGDGENPTIPVYVRGKTYKNLKWDKVFEEFMEILVDYFEERI